MSKPLTCVKDKNGTPEMQTAEYAPDGPVLLATTAPDTRTMVNRSDGTPSAKAPKRPVYGRQDAPDARLVERIKILESQVKSLQIAIGTIEKRIAPPIPHPTVAKAK